MRAADFTRGSVRRHDCEGIFSEAFIRITGAGGQYVPHDLAPVCQKEVFPPQWADYGTPNGCVAYAGF